MDPIELKQMINQYGMPMMAAAGMGYFIYFVWKFVTENINSELSEAKKTMIALIDRIRMLDNDLIRLEQKINTAIEMQRGGPQFIPPPAQINNEKPALTSTSQPPTQ